MTERAISSAGIGRLSILTYIPCFLGGVLVYSLKPVVRPAFPGYLLPVALGLSVWWYSGATQLWVTRQMAFLFTDLRTPAVLPRRRSSVDDSAGPTSREVLLWHLSCPHPLIWLIFRQFSWLPIAAQWMLFLASLATVSMACFFLIEAPCIRLGARIAACLRRDPESVATQCLIRSQLRWTNSASTTK